MSASVPGVLISRDGSVREYVGHSSKAGTLFGRVTKGGYWAAVCEGCGTTFGRLYRRDAVVALRDYWMNADASMAATHVWGRGSDGSA